MELLPQSDDAIRRAAETVLARPAFGSRRTDEEAWLAWLDQLRAWLAGFETWMLDLSAGAPILYWSVVAALVAVALLLVGHVAWTVRVALRAGDEGAAPAPAPSRRDLLGDAERLAAGGSYLEAARLAQLACLELLLRGGVVELRRSQTNRALRRGLAGARLPEASRRRFAALLDALERELFRDRRDDPGLYRAWRELHADLRHQLGAA